VVNNAVFVAYFEQARLAHLRRLGVSWRPGAFAIAATERRFLAPLSYPETVTVRAWTTRVGRTSFALAYEALRASDGAKVAEGSSVQVWLDGDGQAAPLPAQVRRALQSSLTARPGP
jgi:acyl-CoA thioester hydrolase